MHRPLAAPTAARSSSERFAGCGRSVRAAERVNSTGAFETASARRIVPSEAPERSASTPRRFISRTTSSPNRVSPASLAQDTPASVRTRRPSACRERRMPRESPSAAAPAGPSSTAIRPQWRTSVVSLGGVRQAQALGVGADHRVDQIQLLQGGAHRPVPVEALGQVQRPEQRADMPLPQPRHIGVHRTLPQLQVEPRQMPQRPRQPAVAVRDRVRGEDGVRALQRGGGRVGDGVVRFRGVRREDPGGEGLVDQVVELADLGRRVQLVLEVGHGGAPYVVTAVRSPSHARKGATW